MQSCYRLINKTMQSPPMDAEPQEWELKTKKKATTKSLLKKGKPMFLDRKRNATCEQDGADQQQIH